MTVFTIYEHDGKFDIKNKQYSTYNKFGITASKLYESMAELSDIFNNVLDVAITFEIG